VYEFWRTNSLKRLISLSIFSNQKSENSRFTAFNVACVVNLTIGEKENAGV